MGADGSLRVQTGSMCEYFIRAMERRAQDLRGTAQQAVEVRLAILKSDRAEAHNGGKGDTPTPTALRGLLARFEKVALEKPALASAVSLPALDEARQRWDRLRSEVQTREALAAEPAGAGPLNSARLVHRSLHLMRELSPAYLQHFLAYADALSWLEEFDAAIPKPKSPAKKATKKASPRR